MMRHTLTVLFAVWSACGTMYAEDLTIDGGLSQRWNGETNRYENLYIGSTSGNGARRGLSPSASVIADF